MQERHSGFDAAVRMATHAIHLLDHDGRSVREQVVNFAGDVLARFGDPTPVLIDPAGRTPAEIVRETLAETAEDFLQGRRVLVLAPSSWGPHRHDLIAASLSELGARPTVQPETDFVLQHRADAPVGEDRTLWLRVGSEVTTAALAHRNEDRWVQSHRVEVHWGGDDIDDQLVRFVSRRLPESAPAEDLRPACREARERLSDQVTAAVTTSTGSVYLHRKDVEELAGPSARAALTSTVGQVLALSDHEVTSVLVSGGTARTPLVAQLASEISGRPASLVDWRDCVSPLLVRPQVHAAAVAPDRDDTLPLTDQQDLLQRPTKQQRRRVPILAGVAGGVAVLAFAVVGGSQIGGGTDLLRGLLGGNSASVPGGPPGAYAATQSPAPGSSAGPGSPAALTNSVTYGQPGQAGQPSGRPGAAPNTPAGSPSAPGVPSNPAAAASVNPASPAAPPNAPAPAPAAPAPAPAPPAPATSAPAPPADPPPPTSSAPPRTSAPPTTQAPVPEEPSHPADPEPSSDTPAPADPATPDASAP